MPNALSQGLTTNWTRVDHNMLTNADGSAIKGGELVVYVVAAQVRVIRSLVLCGSCYNCVALPVA